MKSRLLLTVLILFTSYAFSQSFDVSGTVSDGSGLSLPGVNVKLKIPHKVQPQTLMDLLNYQEFLKELSLF